MISILIVDDDIATVEVIRSSIHWSELGIDTVYTAYNVSGAKRVLVDQKVDIIISDIEMPQETGLDLLKWVRDEKLDCEFLLLTCHEKFSYATNAIHYEAAAYLTKPFDLATMVLNLQKIVTKLRQKRDLQKSSEYGEWMERNLRYMKLDFWKDILEGEISASRIGNEIKSRHLDISEDKNYCLVYLKVSNMEEDMERYGRNVLEFVLEEFQSEILTGRVENESVVKFHSEDHLSYITICDEELRDSLKENCQKLLETCKGYFKASFTCCISNAYTISNLAATRKILAKLFDFNVGLYGKIFHEDEVESTSNHEIQILDLEKLLTYVMNKDRARILNYLKQVFDELSNYKKLNRHTLYLMKQEIMQVVYTDLMKQGIQATRLFYDDISIKLADCAINSTIDMIRWVNYLLEKTFEYEEEVAKSATIIEKINRYIHEHYMEDIGRNEISAEFYLTPEYLAKLYKKKTGINLKDYINEYRIERAKELLKAGNRNISNIAESVGFDNFTYFSTLFKKVTGVSPKEYKRT